MNAFFRRGEARVLSAYIDGLIVKHRTGRDRAPRADRAECESLDGLVELAQALSGLDLPLPDTVRDRLEADLAATRAARDAAARPTATTHAIDTAAIARPPRSLFFSPRRPSYLDIAGAGSSIASHVPGTRGAASSFRALAFAGAVAVVLTAAVLDWRLNRVSAAELLRGSALVVRTAAQEKNVVVHRVVRLEQRDLTRGGRLVGRQRIETWERGDRGVLARRAFDERQQLVAGRWRDGDRDRTVYARDAQPAIDATDPLVPAPRDPFAGLLTAWQIDLTAEAFIALLPEPGRARVMPMGDRLIVAYDAPDGLTDKPSVRAATLTLRRDTLWPIEQTVVIARRNALDEFRFAEDSFERVPPSRVAARVFQPDASLLAVDAPIPPVAPPVAVPVARPPVEPPAPPMPSALDGEKLLMKTWHRLHRVDACIDESTTVAIDGRQHVVVHASVLDEGRRELLERTFEPLTVTGSLTLEVGVHAAGVPAASVPGASALSSALAAATQGVTAPPALAAVREHFRSRVGYEPESVIGPQLDQATRQFAQWTLERSARRVEEAGALARHLAHWSPEAERLLDLDTRAAWMSMLRQHARSFEQETEMLRLQLSTIFVPIPGDDADAALIDEPRGAASSALHAATNPAAGHAQIARTLPEVIARLRELAIAQDAEIRRAFAPAAPDAASFPDHPQFDQAEAARLVRALAQSERLAQGFDDPQLLDR